MVVRNGMTDTKLANGEVVHVNDHVYVSLPWSERDGTPYNIARIIEFLPPNTTPKKGQHNPSSSAPMVRLSLFYRPSDISGRNVSDYRLLLAAIHTDVQPLSNVRGKCHVRHKDRIDDLIAWKRLPDHFYFIKYFDPYIKREFEVIRTETVNNIPPNVRETLLKRYEYIITEREMVADLTDNFRSCCVCKQWAASQESVRCEACKNHYHMSCLTPPLLAKPAKGYSWVCLPCSMQRRKDVEDHKFVFGNGSAPKAKQTVKSKEKTIGDVKRPDVTYRGWPWRYFGLYTEAQDTLDPDDQIFPRAVTRVGIRYQASVLSWEEQQAAEARHGFGETEAGPSRHLVVERGHDIGERKHESTIDIWSTPSEELDTFMSSVKAIQTLPVPPYDVERLNTAAVSFTNMGPDKALRRMTSLKMADYKPIIFNDKETVIFEKELEENGGLDTHRTAKVLGKRPAEVLRFSYIWKNKKLKAENEALRAHHKVNTPHARQNKTLGAPSLGRIRARADSDASDDEVSLYNAGYASANKMQCAICSTRISDVWWKCPRSVHGSCMCENCGSNYRKYGHISWAKADDSKKAEKENKQKKKTDLPGSGTVTPLPPPPKLPPCACCRRMEPKSSMARCKTCTFSVHSGCYGIASLDMGPDWECELCANVRSEESNLDPKCVLCPKELRDNSVLLPNKSSKAKKPPLDFDLLSALKPTEGLRWAHILCSAWIPEVLYTSTVKLKTVENIMVLGEDYWSNTCSLCEQPEGATIHCSDCEVRFHASCAYQAGYKFGFEMSLAKPGNKREVITIVRFKENEGVMNARCFCRNHDLEGRTIYDMHEIDPEQNETALQIYTAAYKTLPAVDQSFALLRKATRLDEAIPIVEVVPPEKRCIECEVDVSPRWHQVGAKVEEGMEMDIDGEQGLSAKGAAEKQWQCHQCWFASD